MTGTPSAKRARGRKAACVIGAISVASSITACGSSGSKATGNGSQGTAPAKVTTIAYGNEGGEAENIVYWVGNAKGFFADEHVRASSVLITPATGTQALAGGSIDVLDGANNLLTVQAKDPDIKVICTPIGNQYYVVSKPSAHINSLSDLKGATVAITSPGGGFDVWLKTAITKFTTLKPGTDVKFVYVGQQQAVISAVAQGTAQAGTANATTLQTALKEGLVSMHFSQQPPGNPSLFAVNESTVNKRNDHAAIAAFLRAWVRGAQFAKDPANKAEVLSIIEKNDGLSAAGAESFYDSQVPELTTNLAVPLSAISSDLQFGGVAAVVGKDPSGFVDNSFLPASS